ncbi:MAG: FAD-dependent thymidylate synthase, partial [Mogibacterium sp.]|nr:FAD-dependent thymidylate synthase [Mogibacterium sp.]
EELIDIERIARTCYKSEPRVPREGETAEDVTKQFVSGLIKRGHEAMLEHSTLSVRFVCERKRRGERNSNDEGQ